MGPKFVKNVFLSFLPFLYPSLFLSSGKKSPDLGEYDPLTQADSDESEDDLVLNLQKNGGVKNGKSALEEVQDPDSDVEVGMTKQHPSESTAERYPAEAAIGLEQKAATSLMPYLRTAVFLLTMVISMILVLVCAFLIPCPPRDLHNTWMHHLGQEAGEKSQEAVNLWEQGRAAGRVCAEGETHLREFA